MLPLRALLLLGLTAATPALAQPGAGLPMGPGGESVADVLTRRARVLDDTLGLDDTQEARLRTLLADYLDTLAARATRSGERREGRRPPPGPGRFEHRERRPRHDHRAARPAELDVLREPLFATLDTPVRALLTPEQAARYDAFRSREQSRAEAFRADRPDVRRPRGPRRDAPDSAHASGYHPGDSIHQRPFQP